MRNLFFTIRTLKRSPLLTFVGIPGLAVGLTAVLLLVTYLSHELSFDKHFKTKDQVLRVINTVIDNNSTTVHSISIAQTHDFVLDNVPEVKAGTRIFRGWDVEVKKDDRKYSGIELLYADPGFFKVFGKVLLLGDSDNALKGSGQVVLTESTAIKFFGTTDCVGQSFVVDHEPCVVSGVLQDFPETTHFEFDMLASLESLNPETFPGLEFFTYFLVDPKYSLSEVARKIEAQNDAAMIPWETRNEIEAISQTELLADIHLHTKASYDLSAKGNIRNILTVSAIAFFILLIALINFINLYVLHGEKRIGEISTRRSFGAGKVWLARLFFTDAAFIGVLAIGLAFVLTAWIQPWFGKLMLSKMELSSLFTLTGAGLMLAVLLLIVFLTGAYPLFFLSRLNILVGLQGKTPKVRRKSQLSILSLVVQFVITMFLVGSLFVMNSQLNFLKNVPLGFEAKGLVNVNYLTPKMKEKVESIERELEKLPFVQMVGSSVHSMGGGCSGQGIKRFGSDEKYQSIAEYRVQPGFAETMQLKLIKGRFAKNTVADEEGVVLNQAAAKMLGIVNKVGEMVNMGGDEPMPVLGIVENFYYDGNAGLNIQPLALTYYDNSVRNIYLRTSGEWNVNRKKQVEELLKQFDDSYVLHSRLVDDIYGRKYAKTERTMSLVSAGALLTILLSISGLIALSVLNVQRRTKEIGVRKVLGSSENQVMQHLMKNTLRWILASMVIAWIAMYYMMQEWLSEFVNKIDLTPKYFLLSGVVIFLFAALSIVWQSWQAATRNPVEALRYE